MTGIFHPVSTKLPRLARDGADVPFYASVRETLFYDEETNRSYFAYEAWNGTQRRQHIGYRDHVSGMTVGPVDTGLPGVDADNNHGVPAQLKDHEGYLHVFGGSHITSIGRVASLAPNSITSGWSEIESISTASVAAYPHPVRVGDAIYLFYRKSQAGDARLYLTRTTGLSGGVVSGWTSPQMIFQPDPPTGERAYAGNFILVGTEIWFIVHRGTPSDNLRSDLYFFRYDTTDGSVKNFEGTVTVASGSLPVNRATADASFRIYDHAEGHEGTDTPVWVLKDGVPHVFVADGPTETQEFDLLMLTPGESGWDIEDTGIDLRGRGSFCAPSLRRDGSIDVYYNSHSRFWPGVPPEEFQFGGDAAVVRRSASGVWGPEKQIITGVEAPIHRYTPANPAHPSARMLMAEIAFGIPKGTCRIFLHGARGFMP